MNICNLSKVFLIYQLFHGFQLYMRNDILLLVERIIVNSTYDNYLNRDIKGKYYDKGQTESVFNDRAATRCITKLSFKSTIP